MKQALKDLPTFTIELVYEGRQPEIKDAFHVTAKSVMFHKENLCRLLEAKIPTKYTKLAFLDADILFNKEWYKEASRLLDTHDVVQLFSDAHWLDSKGQITLTRKSVAHMKSEVYDSFFHPGFAWGFRREWYKKHGFFDWAVSGSGDALSVIRWMDKKLPKKYKSIPKAIEGEFKKFKGFPRLTYLDVEVSHLYHGARKNRKYVERHMMIDVEQDIRDMITINKDGVYEWKDESWNECFMEYFISRKDDEDEEDTAKITS